MSTRRHPMTKTLAGFSVACLVSLFAMSAWATTLLKLDLKALVAQSEQIVEGKVHTITSKKIGGRIYTDITLTVINRFKGAGKTQVTFRQLGGRVGDLTTYVPGQASFRTGEHVVVFLERPGNNKKYPLVVTGMVQGKFKVVLGPDNKTPFVVPQVGKTPLVERKALNQAEKQIRGRLQNAKPSQTHQQAHALDVFKAQIKALQTPQK